jgi:hypothetical protein
MRELTRRKSSGDLTDQLICDHALFHLEADLRWLELTAVRIDDLRDRLQRSVARDDHRPASPRSATRSTRRANP